MTWRRSRLARSGAGFPFGCVLCSSWECKECSSNGYRYDAFHCQLLFVSAPPKLSNQNCTYLGSFLHVGFAFVASVIPSLRVNAVSNRQWPNWKFCSIFPVLDAATRGPKDFREVRSDLWLIRVCDLSHNGWKSSVYPHCRPSLRGRLRCTRRSFWPSASRRRHPSARKFSISVEPDPAGSLQLPYHCARRGQMEAQKWIAENPAWHVERWSCHPYGKVRLKI